MKATVYISQYLEGEVKTARSAANFAEDTKNQENRLINIYPEVTYQVINGFGGAITESVGDTLNRISKSDAIQIIYEYFGDQGMGYRFIRTHIDSCDFSLGNYSACEDAEDTELRSFSLARDEKNIIPWIKEAYEAAGTDFPVMLTPWSPPAYMKTNGEKNNGGKLKKEYYGLWAAYLCRYVKEYRRRGINVTMLSVQNEPNATQTWDSCIFTAEEEKEFLKNSLYPALQKNGLEDIKVYIWDHNKERLYERVRDTVDSETGQMIDGACFHFYSGDHFDALRMVREKYPKLDLVFSEGCVEYSHYKNDDQLKHADKYIHDIIGNLCAGMNIFLDWNIVLNEEGGPNHVGNYCEAPVICNTLTGTVDKKLSYCSLWHFSHFIEPGSRRIGTSCFSSQIEVVAAKNGEGDISLVIYNRSADEETVCIRLSGKIVEIKLPGSAICSMQIREAE